MKDEQLFYFEESSIFKSDDAFLITDDDRSLSVLFYGILNIYFIGF